MSIIELEKKIDELVVELVNLSNSQVIIERKFTWLELQYIGRGSDRIQLYLNTEYSPEFQVHHMTIVLNRLTKIKADLLEG